MTVSAMSSTSPVIAIPPAAVPVAAEPVAADVTPVVAGEAVVAEDEAVLGNESRWGRARHTHRHVQRHMKHLDREVRHAVFDALKEAEGLDKDAVREIRTLTKEFRMDLQDLFHEAGQGQDFDPQVILAGIAEAARDMADGLLSLRERYAPVVSEDPAEIPVNPQWSVFVLFLVFFVIAIGLIWYMLRLYQTDRERATH